MKQSPPVDLAKLPPRTPAGHKGTFGTVSIFGGCAVHPHRMIGAPALTARAALRTGAGLAKLILPASVCDAAIALCPSATARPVLQLDNGDTDRNDLAAAMDAARFDAHVLAVGPGLGTAEGAQHTVLLALQQAECHLVLDADGINCMSLLPELQDSITAPAILTPHPGEFKRLAGVLLMEQPIDTAAQRQNAAEEMARRLGCIIVLKGSATVVTDGHRSFINTSGSAALATAGTGDVLTGIIASLVAQFVAEPSEPRPWPMPPKQPDLTRPWSLYDAACFGVWLHGAAADAWCAADGVSAGLLAAELADAVAGVIEGAHDR